jgi:hypothetical protein
MSAEKVRNIKEVKNIKGVTNFGFNLAFMSRFLLEAVTKQRSENMSTNLIVDKKPRFLRDKQYK